jgi:hypothetical protein
MIVFERNIGNGMRKERGWKIGWLGRGEEEKSINKRRGEYSVRV